MDSFVFWFLVVSVVVCSALAFWAGYWHGYDVAKKLFDIETRRRAWEKHWDLEGK